MWLALNAKPRANLPKDGNEALDVVLVPCVNDIDIFRAVAGALKTEGSATDHDVPNALGIEGFKDAPKLGHASRFGSALDTTRGVGPIWEACIRSKRSAGVKTNALRTVRVRSMPKSSAARVFEPAGGFFRKARTFSFNGSTLSNRLQCRTYARLWGPGANSGLPMLSLATRG